MVSHMKTTIEIPDAVLRDTRKVMHRDGVTMKHLVESALRHYLAGECASIKREFRLRKATFRGKGLRPEIEDAAWERVRAMVYKGRGA